MAKTKLVAKLQIEKTYFESTEIKLCFQKRKTYSQIRFWTVGSKLEKCRDSLAKRAMKGYVLIWIVHHRSDGRD
jgi:hypothetical protein